MYKMMLQSELIKLDCNASNLLELFHLIGTELEESGYVTEDYIESLIERERQFPTGLKTKFLNIAIPHTDPEVIRTPFIFVVRNKQPIATLQMGDNSEMTCKDFLFLGIKDPRSQVGLLAKLMDLFSKESFVAAFVKTDEKSDIYQLFKKTF